MATTTEYGIDAPGYRLPAGAHVGVVRLQIADLERSIAYYGRVLGLEAVDRSAGRAVLGATDGAPLIELRERPGAAPVTPRGRLGLYHYAILLPDRAALGSFVRHLSEIGERVGHRTTWSARRCTCRTRMGWGSRYTPTGRVMSGARSLASW